MGLAAIVFGPRLAMEANFERGGPCLGALQATRRYLQHKVENSGQNF
jgi:hypothetical protein